MANVRTKPLGFSGFREFGDHSQNFVFHLPDQLFCWESKQLNCPQPNILAQGNEGNKSSFLYHMMLHSKPWVDISLAPKHEKGLVHCESRQYLEVLPSVLVVKMPGKVGFLDTQVLNQVETPLHSRVVKGFSDRIVMQMIPGTQTMANNSA